MALLSLIKNTVILTLILFCVVVPAVIFFVKFDNLTPIGHRLKSSIIKYPRLVNLINLNEPGDARYIYLNRYLSTLSVTVYYDAAAVPDSRLSDWLQRIMAETTGKQAAIKLIALPIRETHTSYSDLDLNRLHDEYASPGINPVLTIVYLSTYQEKPTFAGITMHRDTLFIFKNTITQLTARPEEVAQLEQSTLMHEWGHLLGLDHNDFQNCIMSSSIDVESGFFQKNSIATNYCWNELYELSQISGIRK